MIDVEMWPIVGRETIVKAYRPQADGGAEAPFRTLRRNSWATAGRKVAWRRGAALEGTSTLFCSLNVDAARLARRGHEGAAERVAAAAGELETSPLFEEFIRAVSGTYVREHDAAWRDFVTGVAPPAVDEPDSADPLVIRWRAALDNWLKDVAIGRPSPDDSGPLGIYWYPGWVPTVADVVAHEAASGHKWYWETKRFSTPRVSRLTRTWHPHEASLARYLKTSAAIQHPDDQRGINGLLHLFALLYEIAAATQAVRESVPELGLIEDVIAGVVVDVDVDTVTVDRTLPTREPAAAGPGEVPDDSASALGDQSQQMRVPRWLAEGAGRSSLGACLYLVYERVDDSRLVVEAMPGLAIGLWSKAPEEAATPAQSEGQIRSGDDRGAVHHRRRGRRRSAVFERPPGNVFVVPDDPQAPLADLSRRPAILVPVEIRE